MKAEEKGRGDRRGRIGCPGEGEPIHQPDRQGRERDERQGGAFDEQPRVADAQLRRNPHRRHDEEIGKEKTANGNPVALRNASSSTSTSSPVRKPKKRWARKSWMMTTVIPTVARDLGGVSHHAAHRSFIARSSPETRPR